MGAGAASPAAAPGAAAFCPGANGGAGAAANGPSVAFAVGAGNDAPGGGGGPQPGGAAPAAHAATGIWTRFWAALWRGGGALHAERRPAEALHLRWRLRGLRRSGVSSESADIAADRASPERKHPALVSPNDSAYS
mmetsp:Transcript_9792/g.28901  ORF Transcript_9792/g.28901 Transcript_9792/m.28901 type:complete len:136 (-) Transcript_9792:816-1223(-)